jgi:type VI secretion system protein ImpA
MPSDPVLDFDALLAPISDDRPAGIYLREDPDESGVYYDIKAFRDDARTAEEFIPGGDDGIDETPPNPVEQWNRLLNKCVSVLESKTKDLEFAAYLTEALVRVKQAAGLRDGFRLMREFVERFWDGLNPPPDPEESDPAAQMSRRLNPVGNLNTGTLTMAMDGLYLSDPDMGEVPPTFLNYHSAHAAAYPKSGKGASFEKMQELKKRVTSGSPDYIRRVNDDLIAAKEELQRLDETLIGKVGSREAPSVSKIKEKLEALLRILKDVAGGLLEASDGQASNGDLVPGTPGAPGVVGGTVSFVAGPAVGREDALRTLLEIAAFFRKTEPHSPVSYHVEEAVRWGRMSLAELLKELIPNGDARGTVLLRIGIQEESQPPPSE